VDDDVQVLRAIRRDVQNRYRKDYRVAATESAPEALELIGELKRKNEPLALIVSDQRMPEMEGTEFLEKAKAVFPDVRTVLLTAYSDIEAAIKAINDIRLDYYLLKPWSPPEEKLYPVLDELLDDWQASYRPSREGLRVVGFQWSAASHAVKQFLSGNLVPFSWLDIETHPEAEELLAGSGAGRRRLRRFRRIEDAGDRAQQPRRTGQQQRAHRKLPGLPVRPVGRRAEPARHHPGPALRRRIPDAAGSAPHRPAGRV
jgi:CheY-like chemotaxis protein